jgi:hypothetical protein
MARESPSSTISPTAKVALNEAYRIMNVKKKGFEKILEIK